MYFLTTVRQIEKVSEIGQEKPEVLPWFLGFLVAMILLNVIVSKLGSRKLKDEKKNRLPKEK